MADTIVEKVVEEIPNLVENATAAAQEVGPEGKFIAYASLLIMALIPVYFGAFKSITYLEKQKASGEPMDIVTTKDAAMFPIIASCALFGLYVVFSVFSKDHVNLLLSAYFFVLGVFALAHIACPVVSALVPACVPVQRFKLFFSRESSSPPAEVLLDTTFSTHDVACTAVCAVVGVWYLLKKHWVANNILGLAFAINGIELITLNSMATGALLLGLLFVYDIFWVFGTDVMVTVAKSFDAPIKLVFPQDIFALGEPKLAMLGLGDIVIPGIFIALLLRFDKSLGRGSHAYFNSGFAAYLLGLLTTMAVMHFFKAAQPALLYLVPACVGLPSLLALVKGELKAFYTYGDSEEDSLISATKSEELTEEQQEEDEGDADAVPKRVTRSEAKKEQ